MRILTGLLLLACLALGLFWAASLRAPGHLEIARPEAPGDQLSSPPPPVPVSVIRLPMRLSDETLLNWAESAVPPNFQGSAKIQDFGPALQNAVSWGLLRGPFAAVPQAGAIAIRAPIDGQVTIKGKLEPAQGRLGRLLGDLKPSADYGQTVDLRLNITARMTPKLRPDWSFDPQLYADLSLTRADARIAGLVDLPLDRLLEPHLKKAAAKEAARLSAQIAQSGMLRDAAERAWASLCAAQPISGGQGPDFNLLIRPQEFAAAPITISETHTDLELGLTATLQIQPADQPAAPCPPFNARLRIAPPGAPESEITLDGVIDFAALNAAIDAARREAPEHEKGGYRIHLDAVSVHPFGARLLIELRGSFSAEGLFGARASGAVFLTARPELLEDPLALAFRDVAVMEASRAQLARLSLPIAGLLEPLVKDALRRGQIDLQPQMLELRARAGRAAEALRSANGPVRFTRAEVSRIALRGFWHDADGIRLRLGALARFEADLQLK